MEELIRLILATMIFLSDFEAEHMYASFSQVSSDIKPVKIAGKGSECYTVSSGIELLEVTFVPIRIGI